VSHSWQEDVLVQLLPASYQHLGINTQAAAVLGRWRASCWWWAGCKVPARVADEGLTAR